MISRLLMVSASAYVLLMLSVVEYDRVDVLFLLLHESGQRLHRIAFSLAQLMHSVLLSQLVPSELSTVLVERIAECNDIECK